jgi:hypothetical protein
MKCIEQQHEDPKMRPIPAQCEATANDALSELFAIADRLIPGEMCKNKGYARSKADNVKYAEAVLGGRVAGGDPAVPSAHVGVAAVSRDSNHWEPWTGFRMVRPIIRGPSALGGSTVRNRFRINEDDRERHEIRRLQRIARVTEEASEASLLVERFGCGNVGPCESNDTLRGDECISHEDYDEDDPFGHGFSHANFENSFEDAGDPDRNLLFNFNEDSFDDVDPIGTGVNDEDGNFWRSLDVDAAPGSEVTVGNALSLFHYSSDVSGLCDAVIDTVDGIIDGTFELTEGVWAAIEQCMTTINAANAVSGPISTARDRLEAVRLRISNRVQF